MSRLGSLALGFQELRIGDSWTSPGRTITESDVVAFAGLSGDFNPLHMDEEFARQGPFRGRVAHGLLGLAVSSGLGSHAPRVETLAFLGIREWKFLQPIALGDTVRVISTILELEPKARGRRGIVTWNRRLINQRGETVQEGTTQTLVRSTTPADAEAPEAGPNP